MTEAWAKKIGHEDVVGLDIQNGHIVASHFKQAKTRLILDHLSVGEYEKGAPDRQIAKSTFK